VKLPALGEFPGVRVVVTGASSGIGRESALAFAARGARVALLARRRPLLEQLATEIRARGGEALVVAADVGRVGDVAAAFRRICAHFGGVDVVVNNAGILVPALFDELHANDLARMLRVNLYGALFVMQHAVRIMRAQPEGGSIVNVASLAGRRGVSPIGGYCASKFALVGLTEALRTELHGSPIHVGLVMPGVTDTPMVQGFTAHEALEDLWPAALTMPTTWVVWAILAAVRFRLVEVSVPPGAVTLEKLAALAPGLADSVVHWASEATRTVGNLFADRAGADANPEPP
jgi:NAD(P)-dependent dehydrogenase (short-subunit alcohol dehydrogenase family)